MVKNNINDKQSHGVNGTSLPLKQLHLPISIYSSKININELEEKM